MSKALLKTHEISAPCLQAGTVAADRQQLELRRINTIRTLAIDAVQKANNAHPGTPTALAPLAFVSSAKQGIDVDALAAQLQTEGADAFVKSRNDLLAVISTRSAALVGSTGS